MRRLLGLTVSCLVSACAGGQAARKCPPEAWQGECQLASITKVADKEFPIPHVIMEAVYRPIPNANYPGYTPGALAHQTMVKSEFELPLYDYIENHPRVACSAQAPPNGACVAPQVVISLAPFNPETAAAANTAAPVTGCAQIESSSAQDQVRQAQQTHTIIDERIHFAESSAELPPDADALTAQVAKLLGEKPTIECLGIVGQIAQGESPALAEQRAKAVRDLLGAHGVSSTRLLTIGATAKVFGVGARPGEGDPADRRVSFSVLLERAPAPVP